MANDHVKIYPQPTPDFDSSVLDVTDDSERVTVGLVPSPDHAERIVADIAEDLLEMFHNEVDDEVIWQIKVVPDPLTGSDVETPELLDELEIWRTRHGWSYAISVTDLPIRRDERIVVGEASIDRNLAWVSIPPLGVLWIKKRVRAAILQLMNELRWGTPQGNKHRQGSEGTSETVAQQDLAQEPMISPMVAAPDIPSESNSHVDVRYLAPRRLGHARLLAGMVYANRPWKLFPSFRTTVATAFATGGYMLIFSTVWNLGNEYSILRLMGLTVASTSILAGWIIISHGLWQPFRGTSPYLASLYNTTTLLAIAVGVAFAYTVVFLLLLSASLVFIPPHVLQEEIQRPVSLINYARIGWLGASAATVAGAVGAGLEDTEAVRNATFSWRQQHRYDEYERVWGDNSRSEQADEPGD